MSKFKVGDKVKIIKNPGPSQYGYNQVGDILTVLQECSADLLQCEGFTGTMGGAIGYISPSCVAPVDKPFTKASLRTGMVVVLRDGSEGIVMLDCSHDNNLVSRYGNDFIIYAGDERGFDSLNSFEDDLSSENYPTWAIVEVYNAPIQINGFKGKGKLLWRRETEQEKAIRELDEQIKELEEKKKSILSRCK